MIGVVSVSMNHGEVHGMVAGLLGTAVAWISGAIPTVPENIGREIDEVAITLAELWVVALVASFVSKKLMYKKYQ